MSWFKDEISVSAAKIKDIKYSKGSGDFSVIIRDKLNSVNHLLKSQSLAHAVKPIVYFSSILGLKLFEYEENGIKKTNVCIKLYSLVLLTVKLFSFVLMKPGSWQDTKKDLPLNVLTVAFSLVHETEIFYCILITSFFNSPYYVQLFETLDDIDKHYSVSRRHFHFVRTTTIFCLIIPSVNLFCTFFLRKFKIDNIAIHFSFYTLLVQGAITVLLVLMLYLKQAMLNQLLLEKVKTNFDEQDVCKCDVFTTFRQRFFSISLLFDNKTKKQYCWFELMKMYDLIADCYHLFNKIYAVQVLFMFLTWLVCTLLTICRSLSPSLKYKEIFQSDLFLYTCINVRPFLLAVICECIVRERNKTRDILLQKLIQEPLDEGYYVQIQTMMDLVATRTIEISTNIFSVNIPALINFAGRAISYTVLVIQYFYMHSN